MTPIASTLILALVAAALAAPGAFAASDEPLFRKEESQIPQQPNAPKPLVIGQPNETFRCTRYFTWKGKKFECDSFVQQDGDRLRTIVADVPQAVSEVDLYQSNRAKLHDAAYWGTAGLLIAIGGAIAHVRYNDTAPAGQNISRGITFIGLGLAGGSVLYALGSIQANEAHLGSAVQYYNTAHPNTPIELQFTTGFNL
jgi:hypothetical protein